MKIEYKVGDVTDPSEDLIVHGCNAQGQMNTGVARAVRDRWPVVYHIYGETHDYLGLRIGQVIYVPTGTGKVVGNMITQDNYGYDGGFYVNYDAIRTCLKNLSNYMREHGIQRVAMPRIGSGLGGGDWQIIAAIIEEELDGLQAVVYDLEQENG